MKRYIIGLDEGTTSCRSVLYDTETNSIVDIVGAPIKQYYPNLGWVEQDAEEIWSQQYYTFKKVLSENKIKPEEIIGVGITNQRETIVAWDKSTGKPIYRAIVWQCRRTSKFIENLPSDILTKIKNKTGLIADAYFSASKIKWMLDNIPKIKSLIKQNNLCIGTIDSYLCYKLTGKFYTDPSNASRTMLFNIHTLSWDEELLNYFGIPKSILPEVVDSNHIVGNLIDFPEVPLCAMIGDQQSSLFGQACFEKGKAKATYGTGCFVLANTGLKPISINKMLTTVAYTINGKTNYALEGSVFSACNTINWMSRNLNLFEKISETEEIACSVPDTDGVYFVPAFTGLGAPYWNSNAKGTIIGLTLNTNKAHIVRAGLESMAYNVKAILDEMKNGGNAISQLNVDGGGSKNNFLLQFQADMIAKPVVKNNNTEATAMGAIYMVMLATNTATLNEIRNLVYASKTFTSNISSKTRQTLYNNWIKAVNRCLDWDK